MAQPAAANTSATNTTNSSTSVRSSGAPDSSSSGTASHGAVVALPTARPVSPRDTCAYYDNSTEPPGCHRPRSCFDCLNGPLLNGQVCQLNEYGRCQDVDTWAFGREGVATFRSGVSTYCASDDTGCEACRTPDLSAYRGRVCRGVNDCVCLAWCFQLDRYDLKCDARRIPSPSEMPSGGNGNNGIVMHFMVAIVVVSFITFLIAMLKSRLRETFPPPASRASRAPPRPPRPQALRLEGWQSMRKNLIDHEHATLGLSGSTTSQGNAVAPSVQVEYGDRSHPQERTTATQR